MDKKYTTLFLFSGIIKSLLFNIVVGIVGLGFLLVGFLAVSFLKVVGALVLVFYLLLSIIHPVRNYSEAKKELGASELDRIMETTYDLQRKSGGSFYERVMIAVDDKIASQQTEFED